MLGGLAIVVGRGTMAQAYFVATAEALFLMHHMRSYPYVVHKHNVIDGVRRPSILISYTCTCMAIQHCISCNCLTMSDPHLSLRR